MANGKKNQQPQGKGQIPPRPSIVKNKARHNAVARLRNISGARSDQMPRQFPSGKPVSQPKSDSRLLERDEYIADISGSVTFATTAYPVNPGQASTFPVGSREALLWEMYKVQSLEFYYKPQVTAFATNGQTGKVILSVDYDSSDAPPATKQQIEDTKPHSDGMPCETIRLIVDPARCNKTQNFHYVRPGGLPGHADIKTYDCATVRISTIGCTNTTNVGELRVRYRFLLDTQVLEALTTAPSNYSVAWFQSTSGEACGASGGKNQLLLATATANGLVAVNTAGSIVLPAGNYLITLRVATNSGTAIAYTSAEIQKNAATLQTALPLPAIAIAGMTYMCVTDQQYVTSNGTDAFTFLSQVNYTGAATMAGSVVILAV